MHAAMYSSSTPSVAQPIFQSNPKKNDKEYLHTFDALNDLIDIN